jgi:chromosome partitioning protein
MRLVKQAQSVRGGLPKAVMFLSRAVKGTKLKDEAIALLGKNPEAILLDTVIHQKGVQPTYVQNRTRCKVM